MELDHVTFTGPPIDDPDILTRLPAELAGLLGQLNGFIQFHGGLHVRGACQAPDWHSLRHAWEGEFAFHRLYPTVRPEDVPFAEDCVGDQFLLRDGLVSRLAAETGDVEPLGMGLWEFFEAVGADPVGVLSLQPLLEYQKCGEPLALGLLLSVFPPYCTKESADGVSLSAINAGERRQFLADFAAQIRKVSDGVRIKFRIKE